jgi:hypothetical protein
MSHSFLVSALQQVADTARADANPIGFLDGLASIHVGWHWSTFAARRLGFLSFHWHVIEAFKRARGASMWPRGVRAFSLRDFRTFQWPYDVQVSVPSGDVAALAAFSLAVESWHNDAHMAVGTAIGAEDQMMDPAQNIYLREFWRLHYFINARFVAVLRRYETQGSVARKLERLEQFQHTQMGRI